MNSAKPSQRSRSPFKPVYLSTPWYRSAKGSVCGRLMTPRGEYLMCVFKIEGGWNTVVSSERNNYKQFAVGFGGTPLTYREAHADLIAFIEDMKRHYAEVQTYAAAA